MPWLIRVDVPALADLVDYLRGRDQLKIDAITAEVEQLTTRLNQSQTALAGAVQTEKE